MAQQTKECLLHNHETRVWFPDPTISHAYYLEQACNPSSMWVTGDRRITETFWLQPSNENMSPEFRERPASKEQEETMEENTQP